MNKTILVTGGGGFLGSHLCERLLNDGNYVICVDNFFTGSKANIIHMLSNPRFEFIRHDITWPLYVEVDEIYNLACPASPIHYQHDPIQTTKTSVIGAINLLGLAKRLKIKILQASTSEIYGDPLVHPQVEEYWGNVNPIGPRSCYDEGKRCAETLFFDYHRQLGIPIKVVRIFNTYGPRMQINDGRVVSNFIVQALQNKDITVYGDGQQTRSFCYVSDMIEAFVKMMATENTITGPINLGNPMEFTIFELAETIIRLTGSKSKIIYKELPQDDPIKRKPDISKAKKILSWEPKIQLEDGLRETISYFKKVIS
ncbi:MAG TPA: SDR family oxidoreductase [Victivallales bacterium]|nr:SDR family oxidoreductase [Victivallales bacterium]HRR06214.1 SDR family oxidoreductase [Victivallales bacterium]HRR29514.1 SDR family oxidoreductase [Victivallales bacterium]HRU01903.1 SDR family oxidoreductase [Victivallales bacterium]